MTQARGGRGARGGARGGSNGRAQPRWGGANDTPLGSPMRGFGSKEGSTATTPEPVPEPVKNGKDHAPQPILETPKSAAVEEEVVADGEKDKKEKKEKKEKKDKKEKKEKRKSPSLEEPSISPVRPTLFNFSNAIVFIYSKLIRILRLRTGTSLPRRKRNPQKQPKFWHLRPPLPNLPRFLYRPPLQKTLLLHQRSPKKRRRTRRTRRRTRTATQRKL